MIIAQQILYFGVVLIPVAIIVEAFALYQQRIFPIKRAIIAAAIGNMWSFVVGTVVMALAMLPWHFLVDELLGGTFHPFNKIVTILLMFGGSIVLESFVVAKAFGKSSKRLFLPLSIGNLLAYIFLAFTLSGFTIQFGEMPSAIL